VKGVEPTEPQICAVVDHPKLEHQWLWDVFNAKKRTGVLISRSSEILSALCHSERCEESLPQRRSFVVPPPKINRKERSG